MQARVFLLNDESNILRRDDQWFVFFRPERIAQKNFNGKRPRRDVHASEGDGFWRSIASEKPVRDYHGRVIGFLNVLNFYEYLGRNNDYRKKSRTDGFRKTDWIMYEYRLNRDMFKEWVICKLRRTGWKGDSPTATTEDDEADLVQEIDNMISFSNIFHSLLNSSFIYAMKFVHAKCNL
ncbi:NAC domain-containing protein 2-like [Hibiscus syriacus]|uniref:NAC domain-containing protein 2-like n=1 Tax=Hibiscus syriacus TaxID=106335 RepID=UPI00192312B6|nr:NAC domain-containing protein 2-like [Hibiscus syriacus]